MTINSIYIKGLKLILLQLVTGLLSVFFISNIQAATPLAEWRMNESAWAGTAGEVVDERGSYDGTAQNGATTASAGPAVAGDPGTCRYGSFDGNNDYVAVTNLSNILNGTATLSFWINTTQTGNNAAWQAPGVTGVEESGGADDIFWGWIDASGNIGISVGNDFTSKSTTAINDGSWHHVVLTRDASSGAYNIYIDGSLDTSGTLATGTIGNTFASIGRIEDTGGTPVYFNGQLDEVRVYSTVLNSTEVTTAMNETNSCTLSPIAEWRMDETTWNGTSGEISDETGSYDGTAQNGAVTNNASPAVAGDPGTCGYGSFDGTNDYADVTGLSNILNGTASLAFWINTTQTGNNAAWQAPGVTGVEESGGADDIFWGWIDGSGNIGVSVGNDFTSKSTTSINDGTWHHVVLTRDSTSGAYSIYIDGSLNNSGTLGTGVIGNTYASIGRIEDTGGTPVYFNGELDEVRVYSTVLNATQVAMVKNETHFCSSIKAYYRMDETWTVPATDVVLDYSTNGNHGNTISSAAGTSISNSSAAPITPPNTCGYGVFPQNNNDGQQHAVDSTLVPGNSGSVTFWYRSDIDWDINSGTGTRKLLDATSASNRRFFLQTNGNNGRLIFRLDDGGGNTATLQTPNQSFLANNWVHIAITWDLPNNQLEIYLNGVLSNSGGTTGTTAAAWNSLYIGDNRMVGVSGDGTGRSAGGAIDEVRIYDGKIDSTQVNSDYTSTHPCTLIDHYKIEVVTAGSGACGNPTEIKITAHNIAEAAINVPSPNSLSFSTTLGSSTWGSKTSGSGTWTPAGATATYAWPGGESSVQVQISNGSTVTENINLVDSNSIMDKRDFGAEDPNINFSSNPIIRITSDNIGAAAGSIGTDISGKNSNAAPTSQTLHIQLKQSGLGSPTAQCQASGYYSGTYNVLIAAECIDPSTCAGKSVSINGNAVNTYNSGSVPGTASGNWTPVSMTFDGTSGVNIDTDNKASFYFNYPDAGLMALHFEATIDPPGPPGQTPSLTFTGSSNNFVVRPFGFRIDNFKVDTVSKTNPAATDENGLVFAKAAQDFSADITAVVWQSGDDTDFDGVPDSNTVLTSGTPNPATPNFGNESIPINANITHTFLEPSGGTVGVLTGGGNASGFASGILADHTMSWDEVGIIQLDVTESNNDYLGGGQDVVGQIPFLGRFTPARFEIAVSGSTSFDHACTSGSFTYQDQNFYYSNPAPRIRIRGMNMDGNWTRNYDGDFFKLQNTDLDRSYIDQVIPAPSATFTSVFIDDGVAVQNLGNLNGNVFLRLDNGTNGDVFAYSRFSPEAPFNASVRLTFLGTGLEDDDGICYDDDGDSVCDTTAPTSSTPDDFVYGNITGTELRFGRLILDNAFGSELLALNIPVRAEYYDGEDFITNAEDVCSTYRASNMTLSDVTGADSLVPGDTTVSSPVSVTTLVNGQFDPANPVILDAPGAGKTGSLDVLFDLSVATGSDQEWLRYDWDNDDLMNDGPFDDDPISRATWGIFSGSDEFIYIREPW